MKLLIICLLACITVASSSVIERVIGGILGHFPGFPSRERSRNMDELERIKNEGSQRFENGESGAANKGFLNSGKREFHNIGEHHSKKTTITKSESSESHNIGGSEEFNNGAASSGSFKKHYNGARHYGHEHERGAHASASI